MTVKELWEEVDDLLLGDISAKIHAIKRVRAELGCGLKLAKELVDEREKKVVTSKRRATLTEDGRCLRLEQGDKYTTIPFQDVWEFAVTKKGVCDVFERPQL